MPAIVVCARGVVDESASLDDVQARLRDQGTCVWVDMVDPSPEEVAQVADAFGLHHLIVEDIVESNERAKLDQIEGTLHIVLFALTRDTQTRTAELDFVLGHGFLLSIHPASWDPRSAHQLRSGMDDVMGRGPDALLWALADSIVDGYFPVFDQLADELDDLQDRIIARPDPHALQRVFDLKRELIHLRHVVAPSREVFNQLTSREYELIGEAQVLYFRDVYDHLIRLTDEFDSLRELTATTVEVYLSTVNNGLTVIMKRLTGVTVVLAGIGAVGGIFGMSQATSALTGGEGLGFYAIALVTVIGAILAVLIMRRIGWV